MNGAAALAVERDFESSCLAACFKARYDGTHGSVSGCGHAGEEVALCGIARCARDEAAVLYPSTLQRYGEFAGPLSR